MTPAPTASTQHIASAASRPTLLRFVRFSSMSAFLSPIGPELLMTKTRCAQCHLMCLGAWAASRLSRLPVPTSSITMLTPITTATPAITMKTPGGCVTNTLT